MLRYFKGTCEAIRAMHDYRAPAGTKSAPFSSRANQSASAQRAPSAPGSPRHSEDEDEMFPHPEGDADGGYSYHGGPSTSSRVPLVNKNGPGMEHEHEPLFDGDEELERLQHEGANGNASAAQTELVPYAHRDLKPGYVVHCCIWELRAEKAQERHDLR